MAKWEDCTLGDIADIQTGPFGSQLHAADYVEIGIPSIMPTNIGNRLEIRTEGIACIKEADAQRLERYLVQENDIVYSRRGDVEKCAYVTHEQAGWLCGTGCLRVRFTSKKVYPRFCAYYLSTDEIKGWISGHAVGTTMPNLNSAILQRVPLLLPPPYEQKAIASVLSSLDDKIDLLHRQNKTLEAMAETLFRQWFVEEAQEDWDGVELGDVVSVKGGTTPSTKEPAYWDGDIHWTSPRDLSSHDSVFLFDTERKITELGLAQIGSGLMPIGTVLLSSRAPIGYLAIADIPVAINQGYIAIVCDKALSNYFMYLWCKVNMDEIKNAGNGSTFEEISKSNFKALQASKPPTEKLAVFNESVSPIFDKIKVNQKQIRKLEKLRDTLLPKLMSGEVRVAQA
ncbi:restriction endonuclease subunit S [Methylocaldum sp. 14B]|jgi:type I restriction enzyme S subunit|uniref:restriction endonuclease subunit S n=1 Tax=Methylocaldum sp. 14B TaxID=1912213 RepID=UPI00098A3D3B|nr:restriction endonuclease subunit S [Methylocaldum sp. 14B]